MDSLLNVLYDAFVFVGKVVAGLSVIFCILLFNGLINLNGNVDAVIDFIFGQF